ncbi:NUDIX domain-containing protein [Niallia oryzisoli]|uniref:NUDIX domain-containing protein n=1 Tax=Niallia oryzisoli TaxID=1737571 RepID=UPI0037365FF1
MNSNFCMNCGQALEDREIGGEVRRACPECSFVHWGNYSVGVGALVMKDNKLLLVRRMHDPGKGKWTNPGGFIEQHETIESTIVREVMEETGVTVKVNRIIGLGDKPGSVHHTYITFVMDYVSGEPKADGIEVDKAGFYSIEEMKELNVADFTWRLAQLVINDNHQGFQLNEKINAPANGYRLWR